MMTDPKVFHTLVGPDLVIEDVPEGTAFRKVRMSETLFQQLGSTSVNWGEPDADGFYIPTATGEPSERRATVERIRDRLEAIAAADRAHPPASAYLDECVYGIMPAILDTEAAR